jgi:Ca-activated chloride channel family protein
MAGHDFAREVRVDFPAAATSHDVLATLWARQRVDDLMGQDLAGAQRGAMRKDLQEQIVQLGLDYRLMTQFTSMVAVEEKTVTEGGEPLRIEVPIEMPEGVSYESMFGNRNQLGRAALPSQGAMATGVFAERMRLASPAPARTPSTKLHPWIAILIQHGASGHEAQFVRDGKAAVQVYLSDTSPQTLAQLRALGFEVTYFPKTGSIVAGRIATEKLEALAQLSTVRYIAPRL